MENQIDKNNALVCKHNNLINASYKLNLGEQKLILAISSMVNPYDEDFKEYSMSVDEFAELMNIDLKRNTSIYSRLKRKSSLLLSKRVTIHENDGDLQTTWFASIKYFDSKGKIGFCFAPRLKKYYLQLNQYTKYRLSNISKLNSQYSIRIYELLKQYEKVKNREFSLNEFKLKIGLDNEQYNRFYDLKKYAILVAQKELKEKTDIEFEFEEIKTGRKVTALKFFIKENEKNKSKNSFKEIENKIDEIKEGKQIKIDEFEDENIKYLYELFEEKISKKNIKKIIENAENDIEKIKRIYEYSKTQNIENLVGFMLKMVQGDNFIEPVEGRKSKKETDLRFNNFPQREYDYDKLEDKLLGWDKEDDEEPIMKSEQGVFNFNEEPTEQEEFEDENIIEKMKHELEEEKENEIVYRSEIDTVKMFLEDQLTGVFGEVKYKSWLKYGVDNLDIDDKKGVHFDFKNEFALKIFERDYKDVLLELINTIEPSLKLEISIKK
ncbi:replication initiation protein [Clostridium baratii]|uniref:replication initiation protein n=1 Tax=Clostridium baratii TaxID=1561 RepID=UPI0030D4AA7B